jgi:hypothetical protein
MNDMVESIEEYIVNYRRILQEMAEQVIFAKQMIMLRQKSDIPSITTTAAATCPNTTSSFIPNSNIKLE